MNAERLLLVTSTLHAELKRINLLKLLQQVIEALNSQIATPNDQNLQAISASLSNLEQQLATTSLNDLPKTWDPILEQIGVNGLLGQPLAARVRREVESKAILSNEARDAVQNLREQIEQVLNGFGEVASGFGKLGIPKEELEPGEVELSVLFPRDIFQNRLDGFIKELKLIELLIKTAAMIRTGSAEHATIRTISSTDPTIYLAAAPSVIYFVLKSVNLILDTYEKVVRIRGARAEAVDAELDETTIALIDAQAEKAVDQRIEAFIEEIKADRTNALKAGELQAQLSLLAHAMKDVAARIDHGMRIEGAVEVPSDDEGDGDAAGVDGLKALFSDIRKLAQRTRYFEPQGEPILNLPAPSESDPPEPDVPKA